MSKIIQFGQVGESLLVDFAGATRGQATLDLTYGYRFQMMDNDIRLDLPNSKAFRVFVGGVEKIAIDSSFAPSGADNLGNHLATQNLDLAGFNLLNGGVANFASATIPAGTFGGTFAGTHTGNGSGLTGVTGTDPTKLPLAGGTMAGSVSMGGFNFTNIGTATAVDLNSTNLISGLRQVLNGGTARLDIFRTNIGGSPVLTVGGTFGPNQILFSGNTAFINDGPLTQGPHATFNQGLTSNGPIVLPVAGSRIRQLALGQVNEFAGLLQVTGLSTFAGGVTLNNSELLLSNTASARVRQLHAGSTNIFTGPTETNGGLTVAGGATVAGGMTLNAAGSFTANIAATFNNPVTLGASATLAAGANITATGALNTFSQTLRGLGTSTFDLVAGATFTNAATLSTHSGATTFSAPSVLTFSGSPLAFTATTEARFDAGIRFGVGGTLLQAYEETLFVPTVSGGTVAGTATYTRQLGRFVKVGKRVFYEFDLAWTGHTGTGTLVLALPDTAASMGAGNVYRGKGLVSGFTLRWGTGTDSMIGLFAVAGTAGAVLLKANLGTGQTSPTVVDMTGNAAASIQGTIEFTGDGF
jgi:hypothetical protein